jgi:DNA invertase Pin-like site-specific DNA recombinase
VFAEFETNLRRERQLKGINAAKARGIDKGVNGGGKSGHMPAPEWGSSARRFLTGGEGGLARPDRQDAPSDTVPL